MGNFNRNLIMSGVTTKIKKDDEKLAPEVEATDGYYSKNAKLADDELQKYMNRDPFNYDFNADALYQQLKDKYVQQGKMASQDTMGQAAAMTGGYGNSYAQSVGQQAYAAQLQNLNDIVPELYQMALDNYNREGEDMLNKYALYSAEEQKDYERYWTEKEWDRLYGETEETEESAYPEWYQEGGTYASGAEHNTVDLKNLAQFLGVSGGNNTDIVRAAVQMTGQKDGNLAIEQALGMMHRQLNYGSVDLSDTNILNQIKAMSSPTEIRTYVDNLERSGALNPATADYYKMVFGGNSQYGPLYDKAVEIAQSAMDGDSLARELDMLVAQGLDEDVADQIYDNWMKNNK